MGKWNTNHYFSTELYLDDGVVRDADDDQTNDTIQKLAPVLSTSSQANRPDGWGELVIYFNSQGFHEPMSRYGGSDNLGWPEEGDDERTLVKAELSIYDPDTDKVYGKTMVIPAPLDSELFDQYFDEIQERELPEGPDGPDDDDWRDSKYGRGWDEGVRRVAQAITEDPDIAPEVPESPETRGRSVQCFAIKFRNMLLECSDEDGRDMICLYKNEADANESAERSDLDGWELVRVAITY